MSIVVGSVKELLLRDLSKLKVEIQSYSAEKEIWELRGEIKNSAGTLCLHLCGNLQHYIGAVLGNSGYIRNREAEFSKRNISKVELLKDVNETIRLVSLVLNKLDESITGKIYPEEVFGNPMTTGYFLIHLAGHLNYHLGQINYHRRLNQN